MIRGEERLVAAATGGEGGKCKMAQRQRWRRQQRGAEEGLPGAPSAALTRGGDHGER